MTATELLARAIGHHQAGRLETAVADYSAALALDSGLFDALNNRGVALQSLGRLDEAETSLRAALAAKPDFADAAGNLGIVMLAAGRPADATASFRRALELRPGSAQAHFNLGTALAALGEREAAATSYRQALALDPAYADAANNLGNVLRDLGRFDEAFASFAQALAARPDFALAHFNSGSLAHEAGRYAEAAASLGRAVALAPELADAHNNLARALKSLGRLEEAAESFRRAVAARPGDPNSYCGLADVLRELGRADMARDVLRQALAKVPGDLRAYKNLLLSVLYDAELTREAVWQVHAGFARSAAGGIAELPGGFANARRADRRLRVGYLSADLREHSVARNLLPLVRAHDRSRVELYFYSDAAREDATTRSFRSLADGWRPTAALDDRAVAERIRADGIDILVCLAGRFDQNRPLVAAYRAAPVQISFLDGATSGLAAMDYLIADRTMVPRGTAERFSERVLCVPRFYLAELPAGLPEAKERAVGSPVTFGSLNNPAKVNDRVLDLWARVLAAVPGSRLLLRYRNWYEAGSIRVRVGEALARHGVDGARVDYPAGAESFAAHMSTYDGIDVALDAFPFSGSTTTFDALAMGVPVVTLPGGTLMSRWSAAMLRGVGLGDLVAKDADDYVRIARALAGDPDRRAGYRRTLRGRLAASSLCDAAGRARQFERLYRAAWRRWCAKQAAGPAEDLAARLTEAAEHHLAGRLDEAIRGYEAIVARDPRNADALSNLSAASFARERPDDAERFARRAIAIVPSHAAAHANLGNALRGLGRPAEAEAACRRAIGLDPTCVEAHNNLGAVSYDLGRLDTAAECFRQVLALAPDHPTAQRNLGNLLRGMGLVDEELALLDHALAANPGDVASQMNRLASIVYKSDASPAALFAAHLRFESSLAAPLYGTLGAAGRDRTPGRRLRIGYLSSDFRSHSAARNLLPMFRAHDRTQVELYLYAEVPRPDALTEAFRATADAWRPTVGLSDREVAERMRADGLDILVTLVGRFDQNRPLVAAYRAAPVQISSHDVATSGLAANDYLIADRTLVPRRGRELFVERVLRVPDFYLSEIPQGLPEVKAQVTGGPVTFGCLNNPAKVSDRVLDLWARVLAAVPGSRLLLRYRNWYEAPALRARVAAALARHGVDAGRVDYPAGTETFVEHMKTYDGIDVALDTFPFSGSTTTFDALLMGVPVVTLPGWSMVSRWSATMLKGLKLDDLIAKDEADYIGIAARLAADGTRRAELRATLRERIAVSPLTDARARARQYERIYRAVWRRWCAAQAGSDKSGS
jgi:predicted O-linked N-acetylglucosamine transferase (SPINDLY family)